MSLANLICVAVVGQYTCLYALESDVMKEAKTRGGRFYGAIVVTSVSNDSERVSNHAKRPETGKEWMKVYAILASLSVLALPHIFLFCTSGFKARQSTVQQRAWMTAWVCANQASFFPLAFIGVFKPEFFLSRRNRRWLALG